MESDWSNNKAIWYQWRTSFLQKHLTHSENNDNNKFLFGCWENSEKREENSRVISEKLNHKVNPQQPKKAQALISLKFSATQKRELTVQHGAVNKLAERERDR